jgi:two-component system OmpR family sensor kinase
MTYSLRGRLLIGLALVILVTGSAAGAFGYRWAYNEAIEAQDRTLTKIAAFALQTHFPVGQSISSGVGDRARIIIDELGTTPEQSHRATTLAPFGEGLHDIPLDEAPWRILIRVRPDGTRLAVRQPTSVRDGIARESALYTILPFVAVMPCLMLVLFIIVVQSLRPMVRLAEHLDARKSDDLERLSLDDTPGELHPFIGSINRLLERVQALLEQQRRFIADASHELRTPITALSLQAENLDQVALSDDGRQRLDVLKDGARRTKRLLDQLLTLARHDIGQAPSPAATSLDQCAKDVVADFLPEAANRGIDLGFAEVMPTAVNSDPFSLTTAIRNLVDNSMRFTPRGGRIDISVKDTGTHAVLTVRDTGPGIPDGELDHVFQPFVRGSQPHGDGTGLGLSIVKRIVDRLDGTIAIENVQDDDAGGCRATIALPLTTDRAMLRMPTTIPS